MDVTWSPAASLYTARVWHEVAPDTDGNAQGAGVAAPASWLASLERLLQKDQEDQEGSAAGYDIMCEKDQEGSAAGYGTMCECVGQCGGGRCVVVLGCGDSKERGAKGCSRPHAAPGGPRGLARLHAQSQTPPGGALIIAVADAAAAPRSLIIAPIAACWRHHQLPVVRIGARAAVVASRRQRRGRARRIGRLGGPPGGRPVRRRRAVERRRMPVDIRQGHAALVCAAERGASRMDRRCALGRRGDRGLPAVCRAPALCDGARCAAVAECRPPGRRRQRGVAE
eukprot:363332-Chlamydomonas_euryale.AAC.4